MIGDVDSSVHMSVQTGFAYGHLVKKVECANYIVKGYTAKLYSISEDTKTFKMKEGAEARKLLTMTNIKTIKLLARATIEQYAENLTPRDSQAVKRLRSGMINGPYHVYGIHKRCEADVCPIKNYDKEEIAAKKKADSHS